MIPAFLLNIKLEQLQSIILKRSRGLSKIIKFFKDIFTSVVQNSSFEWFIGFTAYDTSSLLFLSNIELKS